MYLVFIAMAIGAAVLAAGTAVIVPAVINAVLAFWANGVLANFRRDPQAAPNSAAYVSMLTILGSIGLGITALVLS